MESRDNSRNSRDPARNGLLVPPVPIHLLFSRRQPDQYSQPLSEHPLSQLNVPTTPNENRLISLHQARRGFESRLLLQQRNPLLEGLTVDVKGDGPFGLDLGCYGYGVSCSQFPY